MNNNFKKTLVVYYSLTGNTRDIAKIIQEKTNADIYEIELNEPYSPGAFLYFKCAFQLMMGELPSLKKELPDLSSYDLILVGAPVWWYTIPPPLRSFLAKCDFQNKAVAPFSTYGGSTGKYFKAFGEKTQNAGVLKGFDLKKDSKNDAKLLDEKITAWLNDLK